MSFAVRGSSLAGHKATAPGLSSTRTVPRVANNNAQASHQRTKLQAQREDGTGSEPTVDVQAEVMGAMPTGRISPVVMMVDGGDSSGGSSVSVVDPPSFDLGGEGHGASDENVDSRQYMREVVTLSVEMDHDEAASKEFEEDYSTGLLEVEGAVADLEGAAAEVAAEDEPDPAEEAKRVAEEEAATKAALRADARAVLSGFDAATYVGERHHWMIICAPEQPVAGEECIVLFNRLQSETIRERPRIQMQYAFNKWDLNNNGANFTADMVPAPMPRAEGSDFWWTRIKVPEIAYELNFVLTDTSGLFENNAGQDFMYPVLGGVSVEEWQAMLAEIARKKEEERIAAELIAAKAAAEAAAAKAAADKLAAEEAERKRQEDLRRQDVEKGQKKAEEIRAQYAGLQAPGMTCMLKGNKAGEPLLWYVEPTEPTAGAKLKLSYNRKASPLERFHIKDGDSITLRWGVNGWKSPKATAMVRKPVLPPPAPEPEPEPVLPPTVDLSDPVAVAVAKATAAAAAAAKKPPAPTLPEGDWWELEIDVPFEAAVVNFVVNYHEHYDNNGAKDYAIKLGLPAGLSMDAWIAQLAETFRAQEFETRMAVEEQTRARELRRLEKRKKAQDLVKAVERRKVRHVLYTEPEIITAGQQLSVWYNPQDTPLVGKPNIFFLGGFNRWTHPKQIGPIQMTPPDHPSYYDGEGNLVAGEVRSGSPTHYKATFIVPHDAYKMDFVFSDVAGGDGIYDNRGGYDYHLPIEGCPVKETSLYVVHVAVEMAPIAKVGGLGDVVTALGRAVQEQGHVVEVCLPKYEFFNYSPVLQGQMKFETEFDWGGTRICVTTAMVENLRVWFIEPRNGFFNTQTVYGRYDDEVRFDFFCKASLEFLLKTGRQPDILHCHDWSTAHIAKAYWDDYHNYGLWKPKVVFTIHNLNYGQKKIAEANYYCQKFTTVSPTYAFETGAHPSIAPHSYKFCGIRNGIDQDLWDPETNIFLPMGFTAENVEAGKAAARKTLRERLGMTSWGDKIIVAVVSRLTGQKGVPLIKHTAFRTKDRGGQFVLLGSAPDPKVQESFNELASSMNGADAQFCFKYDEPLSHLIYAAADLIVVPSMFEPCGLTQMIAMRYGAVPVVRHTGGLKDTVFDVDFDKARAAWELYGSSDHTRDGLEACNGFAFEGTDTDALDYALNRAIDAWYNDKAWFRALQKRVMEQDWSWNRPALDYIELYFSAMKQ